MLGPVRFSADQAKQKVGAGLIIQLLSESLGYAKLDSNQLSSV